MNLALLKAIIFHVSTAISGHSTLPISSSIRVRSDNRFIPYISLNPLDKMLRF